MSSNQVNLSSDHSDSPSYPRDTPANQEFVAESQTATPAEIALQEVILYNPRKGLLCLILSNTPNSPCQEITFACEAIRATKEGLAKKKKKRTLVKGANIPSSSEAVPGDKAASTKGKDKRGEDLL
ncbi:hypothetical protein LIER_20636 [Lithospermum erythrorhizon]|uniref:Uncharacterized protein n=1 Tax=Lithospermum erythrorhizon TaxID=34254 RepID=A0AAV3QM89_LITER